MADIMDNVSEALDDSRRVHAWLRHVGIWLAAGLARRRQRRRLIELDEQALRDIGVTRAEAMAEVRKPWWR